MATLGEQLQHVIGWALVDEMLANEPSLVLPAQAFLIEYAQRAGGERPEAKVMVAYLLGYSDSRADAEWEAGL